MARSTPASLGKLPAPDWNRLRCIALHLNLSRQQAMPSEIPSHTSIKKSVDSQSNSWQPYSHMANVRRFELESQLAFCCLKLGRAAHRVVLRAWTCHAKFLLTSSKHQNGCRPPVFLCCASPKARLTAKSPFTRATPITLACIGNSKKDLDMAKGCRPSLGRRLPGHSRQCARSVLFRSEGLAYGPKCRQGKHQLSTAGKQRTRACHCM